MSEIDVAGLYKTIGSLEAQGAERSHQIGVIFKEIKEISSKMPTKDDIAGLIAMHMTDHTGACGVEGLDKRLTELESDRKVAQFALRAAVGVPASLISFVEAAKYFFGRH